MSMSTHAVGFKPPHEKWRKMKAAWDACKAAGVAPPVDVAAFFNDRPPDPAGVEVSEEELVAAGALVPLDRERYRQTRGFELYVEKLPRDVTVIRFENSW